MTTASVPTWFETAVDVEPKATRTVTLARRPSPSPLSSAARRRPALDGVAAVSRIGRYPTAGLGPSPSPARWSASTGPRWPPWLASGGLCRRTAVDPAQQAGRERPGLIVSRQTADTYHLEPGQEVTHTQALIPGMTRVRIIDVIDYFTLDGSGFSPSPISTAVRPGGHGCDFWLRLAPGTAGHVLAQLRARQFPCGWSAPATALAGGPCRRGAAQLGFLSVARGPVVLR